VPPRDKSLSRHSEDSVFLQPRLGHSQIKNRKLPRKEIQGKERDSQEPRDDDLNQ